MENNRFVATVSQVNRRIALNFKKDPEFSDLYVEGELSNFVCHYKSGHMYFTLKDSQSTLKCAMFSHEAERLSFMPENGQNVIARGRVGVYERDGVYQLYAASLEKAETGRGEENIYETFLKLKEKLEKENIFSNNRTLPEYPKKICLITSKGGAVLQDMISVFSRRYPLPELLLFPVLVGGKDASASLTNALRAAGGTDADLVIIARGGGAAEDLWAFNDETLAREIYACRIPVVSAVGHETDFTIADFAADLRAPTPTAAAELVTPDLSELPLYLDNMLADLKRRVFAILEKKQDRLKFLEHEISKGIKNLVLHKKRELESAVNIINALSPEKVFARGYAAVFDIKGRAVKSSEKIRINDELFVRLANGSLTVVVKERT
ncbi:MAG: exodeoxyribonuclease VII large subunit [Oscillospiraceae bacterium]|nr:exodeoxyribonuclease VII large subunit [Oscillospiraceae bacterium]